jgi:c-di-GMP-binding flagellar brake protein YcgR
MSFSLPNDSTKYEHRVEFENISKEYREILIKYIFEEERMMRKSAK